MNFFWKNWLIFDIENWLWKYNFGTFWGPGIMSIHKRQQFHFTTVDFWPNTLLLRTQQVSNSMTQLTLLCRHIDYFCGKSYGAQSYHDSLFFFDQPTCKVLRNSKTATGMDGTLPHCIFSNLKPVEISKNHFNFIWTSLKVV